MNSKQRINLLRLLALLAVIAFSVLIFVFRDEVRQLARYGYPGIFLLALLSNATVLVPAPGVLFVFAMGAVLNPFWVAVVAGSGAALGELSGYLAGFSGRAVAERADMYNRILGWMRAHPGLTDLGIFVLALVPNPFFDLAGIAAGTLKIPVSRFLFYCWLGSIIKMLMFAYLGSTSLKYLFEL